MLSVPKYNHHCPVLHHHRHRPSGASNYLCRMSTKQPSLHDQGFQLPDQLHLWLCCLCAEQNCPYHQRPLCLRLLRSRRDRHVRQHRSSLTLQSCHWPMLRDPFTKMRTRRAVFNLLVLRLAGPEAGGLLLARVDTVHPVQRPLRGLGP